MENVNVGTFCKFEKKLNLLLNVKLYVVPIHLHVDFQSLNKTYGADVPLVLMNSFNTDEDTEKILRKYSQMKIKIFTFNQSK